MNSGRICLSKPWQRGEGEIIGHLGQEELERSGDDGVGRSSRTWPIHRVEFGVTAVE